LDDSDGPARTGRPQLPNDAFADTSRIFETTVPARLDRLPWSRIHWLVVVALGITWILGGLELTQVGSLSSAITESPGLDITSTDIGLAASAYLIGAVGGARFFGELTDQFGRSRLFFLTVAVYLVAALLTGAGAHPPECWSVGFGCCPACGCACGAAGLAAAGCAGNG
jgi:MFS family permease